MASLASILAGHNFNKKRQVGGFQPCHVNGLSLLGTLSEHNGCVNKLSWNDDGSLFASASDDLQICLWDFESARLKCAFTTKHTNNIFGLKFLPNNDNRILITGAMDCSVEYHQLHPDLSGLLKTDELFCHRAKVKAIETDANSPYLFFSASEDGCIRQYDNRLPNYGCYDNGSTMSISSVSSKVGSQFNSPNCLLASAPMVKLYSMRINPVDFNLFVVSSR